MLKFPKKNYYDRYNDIQKNEQIIRNQELFESYIFTVFDVFNVVSLLCPDIAVAAASGATAIVSYRYVTVAAAAAETATVSYAAAVA